MTVRQAGSAANESERGHEREGDVGVPAAEQSVLPYTLLDA